MPTPPTRSRNWPISSREPYCPLRLTGSPGRSRITISTRRWMNCGSWKPSDSLVFQLESGSNFVMALTASAVCSLRVFLIDHADLVDDEGAEPGDTVLGGPGDRGEAAEQVAFHQEIARRPWRWALRRQDAVVVAKRAGPGVGPGMRRLRLTALASSKYRTFNRPSAVSLIFAGLRS